nr:MAG TPA: hypothetical protein [Caudoviricetes sp.]
MARSVISLSNQLLMQARPTIPDVHQRPSIISTSQNTLFIHLRKQRHFQPRQPLLSSPIFASLVKRD